jgi:hypothetical protein
MSDESTPLKDALQKLSDQPVRESAELGLVADADHGIGAVGRVSATLGKGWSASAEGIWQHKTGWRVIAGAKWSKGT